MTACNFQVSCPVKLQGQWFVKLIPDYNTFQNGQHMLENWLATSMASKYFVQWRFNDGQPYYSLLLSDDQDLSTVLLTYQH